MKIVALTILLFAHLFPSPQLVAQQSAGFSSPSSDMPKIGQVPPPEWSQCGVSPPETQLKGLPGKVTQGKLIHRVQPEYPAVREKGTHPRYSRVVRQDRQRWNTSEPASCLRPGGIDPLHNGGCGAVALQALPSQQGTGRSGLRDPCGLRIEPVAGVFRASRLSPLFRRWRNWRNIAIGLTKGF